MSADCNDCRGMSKDVTQITVEVAVLRTQLQHLAKTCESLEETVSTLTATLNQSKGGWFVLSVVATAGAALAGSVFGLIQWIKG